jgi:hypothetical protein
MLTRTCKASHREPLTGSSYTGCTVHFHEQPTQECNRSQGRILTVSRTIIAERLDRQRPGLQKTTIIVSMRLVWDVRDDAARGLKSISGNAV